MGLYPTPEFNSGDPFVCHSIQLRPSLWRVVFDTLERLTKPYAWEQVNPTDAAISEVTAEIEKATDEAIFAGCIMIGEIKELAIETIPEWLLLCDGSTYANVDYPELAAVIHPGYVVDEDHFRVPQRELRFAIGGAYPGQQGGEETHVLTVDEIPSHRHSQDQWGSAPSVVLGALEGFQAAPEAGYTGYEGGGEAHNNMPPYEMTQFFIVARYPNV